MSLGKCIYNSRNSKVGIDSTVGEVLWKQIYNSRNSKVGIDLTLMLTSTKYLQ